MGEDWVELRRFDDRMAAQMAIDFLRDSGIEVETRGSALDAPLDRFATIVDVRLLVHAAQRREAEEALRAMETAVPDLDAAAGVAPERGESKPPASPRS